MTNETELDKLRAENERLRKERDQARAALTAVRDFVFRNLQGSPVFVRAVVIASDVVEEIDRLLAAAPQPGTAAETPQPAGSPVVCRVCNDTQRMSFDESEVPCTHCPVPCSKCQVDGRGAYCAATPCRCDCHRKAESPLPAAPTAAEVKEWRLDAMATPPQAHHVLSPSTLRVVHVSQISEAVRLMRRARVEVPAEVVKWAQRWDGALCTQGNAATRWILSLPRAAEGGDRG